ncbi:MAG: radical SAM protein [Nitrososphaerota archaeon]|nr:radical SAM protein [Nitrososphaerota archaeon]
MYFFVHSSQPPEAISGICVIKPNASPVSSPMEKLILMEIPKILCMERLYISKPISVGLILSYKCTNKCKHCMYACSPEWETDWPTIGDVERILTKISSSIMPSPKGPEHIGINYGLHFTGGEPFLNFDLLLDSIRIAEKLKIPSTFVETNCFWCVEDDKTRNKLKALKEAGLKGILISVNPFLIEHVPFERIERAVRISNEVFGEDVIVYQGIYYNHFKKIGISGTLAFNQYLKKYDWTLYYSELLPMGRACYGLKHLFVRHPAKDFFNESCVSEITRNWHVHVDNYFNYMTGYCSGISLGDVRNLDVMIKEGISLEDKPILRTLVTRIGNLYELAVKEFNYKEDEDGYISKCHLCIDIRRHIVQQTHEFKELQPMEFYYSL